jgi:subtilisin family serine protease
LAGVLATLALGLGASTAPAAESPAPEPVPGEIIVRFKPGTDADARRDSRQDAGTDFERTLLVPRAQLVEVEPGQSVAAAARELERDPDVLYAQPNFRVRALDAPTDPLFPQLWGLDNTGQTIGGQTGIPGADINALAAWDISTGSPDVLVAVVDTGIERSHPDLAANAWTNPGEAGANSTNRRDDDGNGKVDDWRGWDFVSEDNDPADGNRHGTHVSGTIGAASGNGAGVVGVSPSVSLVGVKVLGDGGSGTTADVADGFAYSGRIGARVVNASLGGGGTSQLIHDAIAAYPETLYVVAAGNDSVNVDYTPQSPCAETPDNLICVAATDNRDELAGFSNYGTAAVDVAAPGVTVTSTLLAGAYGSLSGTSMATPHVAGAAALLAAVHPEESALDIKGRLLSTAKQLDGLIGRVGTRGRIDLGAALGAPTNTPPVPAIVAQPTSLRAQERVTLDASGSSDSDGRIAAYDWDLDGNGSFERSTQRSATLNAVLSNAGTFNVGVRVTDNRGARTTARTPVTVRAAGSNDPVARIDVTPSPVLTDAPARLDASRSTTPGGTPTYEWDLDGDAAYDTTSSGPVLEHRFRTRGPVTVALRITTPGGATAETDRVIDVKPPKPTAQFTMVPASPVAGQTVHFDGRASTTPNKEIDWWDWDFEGSPGSESYRPSAAYRFTRPGTYTATLHVQDDQDATAFVSKTFTVRPAVPMAEGGPVQVAEQPGQSDGDSVFEPGEGLLVTPTLKNTGSGPLEQITGQIRSPDPDNVRGSSTVAAWPDLAAGASAPPANAIPVHTYGSMTCGMPIKLDVDVETASGPGAVPVTLPGGGTPGTPKEEHGIWPTTVQPGRWKLFLFDINTRGAIKDLEVKIDEIRTKDPGALRIMIEAPGREKTVIGQGGPVVFDSHGGDGEDILGLVLDDDAPTPVSQAQPPFTGRFRPDEPLSSQHGRNPDGGWQLYIENWSDTETAHVNEFDFVITPAECNRVDAPAPTAKATVSPRPAARGEEVTFDASSSSVAGGRIVEYRWDLDDDEVFETIGPSPTVTRTFNSVGYAGARVQVVTDRRAVATTSVGADIRESRPPTAMFTPDVARPGVPVTLDASPSSDPDGEIVDYAWDIHANGTYDAHGKTLTRVFDEPPAWGSYYNFQLRVTDDTGEQDTYWGQVKVMPDPVLTPDPQPEPEPDPQDPTPADPSAPGAPRDEAPGGAPPVTSGGPLVPPNGGGTQPAPGTGAVRPPAVPRAPLTVRFRAAKRVGVGALRRGVGVNVSCSQDCVAVAQLTVPAAAARKLGLGRKAVRIARATRTARGRKVKMRMVAKASTVRAIRRAGGVRLRLDLAARSPKTGEHTSTFAWLDVRGR